MIEEDNNPQWLVLGVVLVVIGFAFSIWGYIFFWADWSASGAFVPDLDQVTLPIVVAGVSGLVIGWAGWYRSTVTAKIAGTLYIVVFLVAFASAFLDLPFQGETTITWGLGGLTVLTLASAYYEYKNNYFWL